MASRYNFDWSGPAKRFTPPSRDWQHNTASKLHIRVERYLNYGQTKYFNSTSPPRRITSVRADGNCFFRALSILISGVETYHLTIRVAVTKHVETSSDMYRTFLESRGGMQTYVRNMRRPREWATDTEIFAAATLLGTIIEICTESQSPSGRAEYQWQTFQPMNNQDPTLPRVYISHRYDHFEPILDIETNYIR